MQLEQCLVLLCIKLIDNWKVALERCILQFSELLLSLEEKREVSLLRRWRFILRAVGVLCWKNNLKAPGGIRFTELLGPNQISNFCSIPTDSSHPKEHKQGIPQYDEYMESHLHFVLLHFITPHITRLGFRLNVALTCVYICLKGKVCPKKYLYLVTLSKLYGANSLLCFFLFFFHIWNKPHLIQLFRRRLQCSFAVKTPEMFRGLRDLTQRFICTWLSRFICIDRWTVSLITELFVRLSQSGAQMHVDACSVRERSCNLCFLHVFVWTDIISEAVFQSTWDCVD